MAKSNTKVMGFKFFDANYHKVSVQTLEQKVLKCFKSLYQFYMNLKKVI